MIIRAAGKCNLQSTSRQNDPLFCLMISSWGVCASKFFFFISTTYPPSREAQASSCFNFFFLLLVPDSYCRLEEISPPASSCLSALLTAAWSDAARCQSLQQRVRCQITHLFSLSLSPSSSWLEALCAPHYSDAHPLRIWGECVPLRKLGPLMDREALRIIRVLRIGRGGADMISSQLP